MRRRRPVADPVLPLVADRTGRPPRSARADGVERVELEQPRQALQDAGATTVLLSLHEGEIKAREKAYAQDLQRGGKWPHLWRVVGEYANYSVFDVASNDELHALLAGLPLFAYMDIKVTPLARHPSAIDRESN